MKTAAGVQLGIICSENPAAKLCFDSCDKFVERFSKTCCENLLQNLL